MDSLAGLFATPLKKEAMPKAQSSNFTKFAMMSIIKFVFISYL
jgi:hypothetical protein